MYTVGTIRYDCTCIIGPRVEVHAHSGNNLSGFASHCAIQNSDASLTPGAKSCDAFPYAVKRTRARTHDQTDSAGSLRSSQGVSSASGARPSLEALPVGIN